MENTVAKNRQQLAASGKSLWARVMQQALNAMEGGCLKLQLGSEQWTFGPLDADLVAIIRIHDERFFRQVILGGSIGAGEAIFRGTGPVRMLPPWYACLPVICRCWIR